MARYSVLRMLIFFGFLFGLWLLGLRDESERWWLLIISALGSAVVSYFVLQGPRAQVSARIANRVEARAQRLEQAHRDEIDEDSEIDEDAEIDKDTETDKDAPRP